jgi:proton-translocating NADH-quinone oxidoreductase chain M
MLLGILYIRHVVGSTDYRLLLTISFIPHIQIILWLSFFISFMIKIPMIPFHIWLPEAHVEAPTAGSVLLAGILLKLGTYGLIRFSYTLFPIGNKYFTPLVLVISIISIIYSSCTTLRQIDLKKIIAYTSIAHMNLVTVGIFSNTINGLEGAIYLMLSHGIVSTGLFLSIGIIYDRYNTRLIKYYGGLITFMPLYGFVFLVLSLANMGIPGTSSFIGEFLILLGIFSSNTLCAFLSCTSIILSASYSMWLFNRLMFGEPSRYIFKYSDMNERESFYMILIAILVLFFGVYPNSILNCLHFTSTFITQSAIDWPIK